MRGGKADWDSKIKKNKGHELAGAAERERNKKGINEH